MGEAIKTTEKGFAWPLKVYCKNGLPDWDDPRNVYADLTPDEFAQAIGKLMESKGVKIE